MPTQVRSEELDQPLIRRKSLAARNEGGMKAVLGALCGCEAVTFRRTASEMGFVYAGIDFEGAFTIDIRGRMGVEGVRPHFQTVRVQATVRTDESEDRLRGIVEETERRCPVYNLLSDAAVNVEMVWIRHPVA